MQTQAFSLLANTTTLLMAGPVLVRNLTYSTVAAGTLNTYDFGAAALTESIASYEARVRDCEYTRTVTGVRDVSCNTLDYEFTGISDTDTTVAADASYDLPARSSFNLPTNGGVVSSAVLDTYSLGLVARSTVAATVLVTFEPLI